MSEPILQAIQAGRAGARLAKFIEGSLAPFGLSIPQYRTLGLLADAAPLASALAHWLSVSAPTITGIVDGLVARSLIERRPDPTDRRRITHRLTKPGRKLLNDADNAISGDLLRLVRAVGDPTKLDLAIRGLAAWQEIMDAAREQGYRRPIRSVGRISDTANVDVQPTDSRRKRVG